MSQIYLVIRTPEELERPKGAKSREQKAQFDSCFFVYAYPFFSLFLLNLFRSAQSKIRQSSPNARNKYVSLHLNIG